MFKNLIVSKNKVYGIHSFIMSDPHINKGNFNYLQRIKVFLKRAFFVKKLCLVQKLLFWFSQLYNIHINFLKVKNCRKKLLDSKILFRFKLNYKIVLLLVVVMKEYCNAEYWSWDQYRL